MPARRIFLIEDDAGMARRVAGHLDDQGFAVTVEPDGEKGTARASGGNFDLVLLGGMRPKVDGLEICRQLRMAGNQVPIFILGDGSSEIERVLSLEMGADDYLAKPPSLPELCARVRALFRRLDMSSEPSRDLIQLDGMSIDLDRHEVRLEGKPVVLTAKEFDLLSFLASHPGRVFSRGQLLAQVWGYDHDGYEHTVNSHINRLRSKIEPDPAKPQHILTVWRVGYKFRDHAKLSSSDGVTEI